MNSMNSRLDDLLALDDEAGNAPDKKGDSAPDDQTKKAKEELERLQKQYKDLQEHARQQAEELKKVRESASKIDKVAEVFTGETNTRKKVEAEEKEREEYLQDSFEFNRRKLDSIKQELEEKYQKTLEERVQPIQANMVFERCRQNISKKYDVDWEDAKVQKEVSVQLQRLDNAFKQKEPEKALLQALHMSGHLKKRDVNDLPFTESGQPFMAISPKQAQKEADKIRESILKGSGKKKVAFNF